jgi:hypothetical protein
VQLQNHVALHHKRAFTAVISPQLAAVVQPLLLGALQSLTAVLLKTVANYLQRFLYNNRCKISFYSGFYLKTDVIFFSKLFYNRFS